MKKTISLALISTVMLGLSSPIISATSFADEYIDENDSEQNGNNEEESSSIDENENSSIQSSNIDEKNIVKHIIVEGVQNISKEDILKFVTKTKIDQLYNRENVQEDLKNIIQSGAVQTAKARTVQNNGELYVVFEVTELSQIKEIVFSGNTLVKTDEIKPKLVSKVGEKFNKENISTDAETIKKIYKDKGFIAVVSDVNNNNGKVTITISEAKVENISYLGNTKTKSWVIDKTVNKIVKKGDFLTSDAIQKLYINLMSTGFFENVKINADAGSSKDRVKLTITVKEAKTGEWSLGGGYNTQYKAQLMGGISEKNINGEAKSINFDFGVGKNKTSFDLSFVDPYYKKTDTAVTFDIFRNSKDVTSYGSTYTENHTGGSIGMIKAISKDKQTKFFANFTVDHVNADSKTGKPVESVKANTLTLGLMHDTRDNPLNPKEGSLASIALTTSQKIFGSDYNFNKIIAELRNYTKISAKDVLASRLAFNYSPDNLPTVEQFSIGGSDSVRGLDEDAQRGNKSVLATLELRHELSSNVEGVVFVDAGQAWQDGVDNAMKIAAGIGVRIKTSMGILRLDAAKTGGEGIKYMFGIGQSF